MSAPTPICEPSNAGTARLIAQNGATGQGDYAGSECHVYQYQAFANLGYTFDHWEYTFHTWNGSAWNPDQSDSVYDHNGDQNPTGLVDIGDDTYSWAGRVNTLISISGKYTIVFGQAYQYFDGSLLNANDLISVKAVFRKNYWDITFNANGGTFPTLGGTTVTIGVTKGDSLSGYFPTENPTRVEYGISYEFRGWWTARSGGTQVDGNTVPSGDTTYYAHWYTSQWRIYFIGTDAYGNNVDLEYQDKIVTANSRIGSLPQVKSTINKYVRFWKDQWDADIDQSTIVSFNGQTFYATCRSDVQLYFDRKGGTGGDSSVVVNLGELLSSPIATPSKTEQGQEYRFFGYYSRSPYPIDMYFDSSGNQILAWSIKPNYYPNTGEVEVRSFWLDARWLKANILLRNQCGKLIRVNGSLVHG